MENRNIRDLAGLQVLVTIMASYGIIFWSKKLTVATRLKNINEYLVIDWGGSGFPPTATKFISQWGPGGTTGGHTTIGVAVCAPVSTWPGSRRLFSMSHSSYLVHRKPAIWLGALPFNGSSLSICRACVCVCVCVCVCMRACV